MSTTQRDERNGINRRTYLGMAGAAVVGTAAIGTASASTSETVTVAEDERKVVEVGDSETLENVRFDVTAPGAGVTIIATGTDWTIRNVAVEGTVDMGNHTILGVADTDGGTSRIENVWLGDGSVYEEKGAIGLWVDPDHSGHLEIERVNVQEMSDNAFYCSAPGDDHGSGGTVAIRDCYAANCWTSHYRLAEGTVENCVASVTDDRQYRKGRGVWAWSPGPVDVKDCHFDMNGHHYSFVAGANEEGSQIDVSGTEWDDEFHGGWRTIGDGSVNFKDGNGNDPENFVPEGCPTSADDAVPADDDPEDDAPSLDDYRSDDTDRVETSGLQKAFSDWRSGHISMALLATVFGAWLSG
ncbi:hypothetical protein [Natronorubrum bangense]|uniref:Right handed beta helix domain-containing protein n=1 Tax=Natronorubrum bangense JCM 10635 TaxID=1227500 RepID=L9WC92_9EURY|nr:hypothetical protein [Natronorubrum bangense]ELY46977.1 hypothetical protein C494_13811 [Natronorubrum bangense JCM 10635]